jgi:hypothetical protein
VNSVERFVRAAGAGSAICGAIALGILAWTETTLGPAQDLTRGGAGDPARIAISIALLALAFGQRRSPVAGWPIVALGIAASLFAVSGAMLSIGWVIGWQPAVLLGVVNVPALLLLVAGWVRIGLTSRRTFGSVLRRSLPLGQLGLGAFLFALTAVGGLLVVVAEALFVFGWIAIARLIWSGQDARDAVSSERKEPAAS